MKKASSVYSRFSQWAARASGRPAAFISVLVLTFCWAISGPLFGFSDTWQLVMNTASSIITFLMVFIIQNTQNRQTEALQIKLDELIRATQGARNSLLDLEELEEGELADVLKHYERLAREARRRLEQGGSESETRTVGEPESRDSG